MLIHIQKGKERKRKRKSMNVADDIDDKDDEYRLTCIYSRYRHIRFFLRLVFFNVIFTRFCATLLQLL